MQDIVLQLDAVSKHYGRLRAVNSVSFSLKKGEIAGFLGPNGAGKSTSLRIALGIVAPDQGSAQLFGEKPSISTLRRVGFLSEERGLYKKMAARDVIAYFARLKGMSRKEALLRADDLLENFGLGTSKDQRISRLSKGMAQKVQILTTLAHKPDLLILDEPFSGLDPVNQSDLENLILAEHKRGATILFSTHVMEHAERLCERVILIASGRKMFDGTLEQAYQTQTTTVRLATSTDTDLASRFAETAFASISASPEGGNSDQRVWWECQLTGDGVDAQHLLQAAIERNIEVLGFDPGEKRLRDVFVSLVKQAEDQYGAERYG